jgi:hypothetical protein
MESPKKSTWVFLGGAMEVSKKQRKKRVRSFFIGAVSLILLQIYFRENSKALLVSFPGGETVGLLIKCLYHFFIFIR